MAITTNSKRMKVSELDFDTIKTNLKTFLQAQSEFSDYDFEGSGLSVLIDLLAYNTHYNGVYTNLAVNEMFLDSASKRASVVSLSKMLGYTPRSAVCARAIVNASIAAPTSSPAVATLNAQQPFLTSIDGVSYVFYNLEDVTTARSTAGSYTFSNLTLVEGTPLSFKYTVATGVRYIIPNANIDISTLSIQVQSSSTSDIYETYTRAEDLTEVALKNGLLKKLQNVHSYKRECAIYVEGKVDSRFDFTGIDCNNIPFIMEVKNVPLADYEDITAKDRKKYCYDDREQNSKVAYFPDGYRKKSTDTVSPRALKHIQELTLIKKESITRCIMCYVIQRTDVNRFQPSIIDPEYREAVRVAIDAGVEIITMVVKWTKEGEAYFIRDDLPITGF
jgi:DNA-binding sugar fermentation-stimulating protein